MLLNYVASHLATIAGPSVHANVRGATATDVGRSRSSNTDIGGSLQVLSAKTGEPVVLSVSQNNIYRGNVRMRMGKYMGYQKKRWIAASGEILTAFFDTPIPLCDQTKGTKWGVILGTA